MALRVLVVDDSKVMRLLIKKELSSVLAGKEYEITECSSAKQALEKCLENPFDLIFTDLTMPDMTGYQLLEKLKEHGITGRAIVLSADVQEDASRRVLDLGAIAFLRKPLDGRLIKAVLQERNYL